MDKRQLKLGWSLVLLWFVIVAVMAFNLQATGQRVEQIELLGDRIHEFRNSLYFDEPYRTEMTAQQSELLAQITTLCDKLKREPKLAWFQPDIEQLLFTSERFVELSRAFIGTELALKDLITGIQEKRQQFNANPELQSFYFKLSAYVFEALFSSQSSTSMAYRDLDTLYSQSLNLAAEQRALMQNALAQTSSVMGSFAQGGYLVERLISHSVHNEVRDVELRYHRALEMMVIVGVSISGALILFLVGLFHRALLTRAVTAQPATDDTLIYQQTSADDDTPQSPSESPMTESADDAQIDFAVMLDSLGDDKEALCLLLEVFISDHQDDASQIAAMLTDAPDDAMRKAHSLKGVGGNLGAYQLHDIAGKIEVAIEQDISQVPLLLPELETKLKLAIEEAQNYIRQEKP